MHSAHPHESRSIPGPRGLVLLGLFHTGSCFADADSAFVVSCDCLSCRHASPSDLESKLDLSGQSGLVEDTPPGGWSHISSHKVDALTFRRSVGKFPRTSVIHFSPVDGAFILKDVRECV